MKKERIQHLKDVMFTRETMKAKDQGLFITHSEARELISLIEGTDKPVELSPTGTAKTTFNAFWKGVENDSCNRKTLASIAFDAGHSLRHYQTEWNDVKDQMPEPIKSGMTFFNNDDLLVLFFVEHKSLEFGVWDGIDWNIPDLGVYPKDAVSHWLYIPNLKP